MYIWNIVHVCVHVHDMYMFWMFYSIRHKLCIKVKCIPMVFWRTINDEDCISTGTRTSYLRLEFFLISVACWTPCSIASSRKLEASSSRTKRQHLACWVTYPRASRSTVAPRCGYRAHCWLARSPTLRLAPSLTCRCEYSPSSHFSFYLSYFLSYF